MSSTYAALASSLAAVVARQEEIFARAFAAGDIGLARELYEPDVVYLSPTARLYDRPRRIIGIEATLEFIALTIRGLGDIRYEAVESAIADDAASAFVRIHFDWTQPRTRLRSSYVVIYRYRDGRIAQQELYYDPSGVLETLSVLE